MESESLMQVLLMIARRAIRERGQRPIGFSNQFLGIEYREIKNGSSSDEVFSVFDRGDAVILRYEERGKLFDIQFEKTSRGQCATECTVWRPAGKRQCAMEQKLTKMIHEELKGQ